MNDPESFRWFQVVERAESLERDATCVARQADADAARAWTVAQVAVEETTRQLAAKRR